MITSSISTCSDVISLNYRLYHLILILSLCFAKTENKISLFIYICNVTNLKQTSNMTRFWLLVSIICFLQFAPSNSQSDRVDKALLSELCDQLRETRLEAELLYAQTSSTASGCLQAFLKGVPRLGEDSIKRIDRGVLLNGPSACRGRFEYSVKMVQHNAHVAAEYNADNHQKFFLGHMLVFRMHLNKTQLFLGRAESALSKCGSPCQSAETQSDLSRWHRSAWKELQRVRDDIQHSRLAYRDLLLHAARRLGRVRSRAELHVRAAARNLARCARN